MLRGFRRVETWIAAAILAMAVPGTPGAADPVFEPRSHAAAVSVTVDAAGALRLTRGSTAFTVRSFFSRPDGGWLYLGAAPDGAGNGTWKVAVLAGANSYVVVGNTATYALSRTVTVFGNHVEVRDGLTNMSDRVVGVRFGHEVVDGAAAGLVAGNAAQRSVTVNAPERPFVQVSKDGMSIGLVARDDAFRNQSTTYYDANAATFGIRDDNFGLAPGASATTRWEIYPTDSVDPFDFYNAVRAEWRTANATIPGLFAFVYPQRTWRKNAKRLDQMSVDELKDWLDTTGIQTLCFTVTDDLENGNIEAFGSRYLMASGSKAYWRPIVQRLRQAQPALKIAQYFHLGLDVPADPDIAASRMVLMGGLQKAFTNSRGITRWYYYPAKTAAFADRARRVAAATLSDFDLDAFYWDEYSYGSKSEYLEGADWDATSVSIDARTNAVLKPLTLTSLATRDLREALTQQFLDRGLTVWTNWQPTTEHDTALNQPHFLEHYGAGDTVARGYLASPIQLNADASPASSADVVSAVRTFLGAGLLYAHIGASAYAETSPSPLRQMYPITPLEIHAGYVLGRERIVTSISGAFGFGSSRALTAYIYDGAGHLKDDAGITVFSSGKTYQSVVLGPNDLAIVEPAPKSPSSNAHAMKSRGATSASSGPGG